MKTKLLKLKFKEEESHLDPLAQLTGHRVFECACGEEHQIPLVEPILEIGETQWKIECAVADLSGRLLTLESILLGAQVTFERAES